MKHSLLLAALVAMVRLSPCRQMPNEDLITYVQRLERRISTLEKEIAQTKKNVQVEIKNATDNMKKEFSKGFRRTSKFALTIVAKLIKDFLHFPTRPLCNVKHMK